jgi:hypothetical protein
VAPARYDEISAGQPFNWIYGIANYAPLEEVVNVQGVTLPPLPPNPAPVTDYREESELPPTGSVWETMLVRIGATMVSTA